MFGAGTFAHVAEEVDRLGASRVLVIYDVSIKDDAGQLIEQLGDRVAGEFTDIQQHVPIDVVERARQVATDAEADCASRSVEDRRPVLAHTAA